MCSVLWTTVAAAVYFFLGFFRATSKGLYMLLFDRWPFIVELSPLRVAPERARFANYCFEKLHVFEELFEKLQFFEAIFDRRARAFRASA